MTSSTTASPRPTQPHGGAGGALSRRWPTALGAVAALNSLVVLARFPAQVQAWVSAWCLLLAAVVYLTWGAARDDLGHRAGLTAQTTAVLGFGAIAITAGAVAPDTARYVLAAGWLAHAGWDVVHHRLDRVVPRWYAETCLVADLTIAAALLTVGLI